MLAVGLVAGALLAGCGDSAPEPKQARKDGFAAERKEAAVAVLSGSGGWGVSGAAGLVDAYGDGTTMVMLLSDPSKAPVAGMVVSGTCGDAVTEPLQLNATVDGHSDTRVDASLASLLDERHSLVVTDARDPKVRLSCGEISTDRSTWVAYRKVVSRARLRDGS